MAVKSPCKSVSDDHYAEMVEHVTMTMYRRPQIPSALPLLNRIASPGARRLAAASRCPILTTSATSDAAKLIGKLHSTPQR